jgi:hypothetical protein
MRVTGTEDGQDAIGVSGAATGAGSVGVRGEGGTVGVTGVSVDGEGVHGQTNAMNVAAIAAFSLNPNGTAAAVFAEKKGDQGHAGFFVGHVHITRNLSIEGDVTLPNADIAEDFYVADACDAEPGTVMVLCDSETLQPSQQAYDTRVAGVVSGAGAFKPGIVLDRQSSPIDRRTIALVGKVYCKVDARYGAVGVGDLLTTSPSMGHAMKATDRAVAFGAVLGKALRALPDGQGLIPVLITLQ